MSARRLLGLACLLPLALAAAQGARSAAQGEAGGRAPVVTLEERPLSVPVTLAPAGPLVALAPLAGALEGALARDPESGAWTLTLADKAIVLAPGNAVVTVGDEIVSLSQPVALGEGGPQVPVDFLERTYGALAGYSFEWRPTEARLAIGRRGAREVPVAVDVVHLQGTTTVVLQFGEMPRYRLVDLPGAVEVEVLSDRLAVSSTPAVQDSLVQGVAVEPQRVRIALAPGARAESYVLENPFRLVFDIHAADPAQPAGPAFTPPARPTGIRTIVLDPGHGGAETGAVGPGGTAEKDLTLQLAQSLADRLASRLGVRVILTRTADASLPLATRTAIANQNKGDLFVSIHLNSSRGAGAHGAETYFLSAQATDARAARAAAAENAAAAGAPTPSGGEEDPLYDLQLILWDLAQSHHLAESQRFAGLVQQELNTALALRDRGVKQAPFRVLVGAAMPAVLVELGFLSNPEEEKKLGDAAYRAELVDALARAVGRYKQSIEQTAEPPAPEPAPAPAPAGPAAPR
ncbi:MAG TPA: N-acetylmuramoyl-L-alanine amidase [Thermoanaerobaculia bacterium]|nr:N-acetylmuramoyl-L-alanine amidase [Thermoanaerobaculia bacterium]